MATDPAVTQGFWQKFSKPPLLPGSLAHAGMWFGTDLAMSMLLDKETPFSHKLTRAAGWGGAAYLAPALVNAYMIPMLFVGVGQMLNMVSEMEQDRFSQAINPAFHTSDIFSTNAGMLLTERQRSMKAIQTQVMNARSAIGREATLMKRSADSYIR